MDTSYFLLWKNSERRREPPQMQKIWQDSFDAFEEVECELPWQFKIPGCPHVQGKFVSPSLPRQLFLIGFVEIMERRRELRKTPSDIGAPGIK